MDPLEILGLAPGDTIEKAKENRNKLYLKHHPDKRGPNKIFNKISEAYNYLVENPDYLNPRSNSSIKHNINNPNLSYIITDIDVSMEDFYFNRKKSVSYSRLIFCKNCLGTGSSDLKSGVCICCGGKGYVNDGILNLLQKDSKCNFCGGTGIKPGNTCKTCRGNKYTVENKKVYFNVDIDNYHRKVVDIKNVGNQISKEKYSRLIVRLNVLEDNNIFIEDDYFFTYSRVHPVQKIIGDESHVMIFGRKLKYKIFRNYSDAFIEDHINSEIVRKVRVKFIDKEPVLDSKTIPLYRKILSEENC